MKTLFEYLSPKESKVIVPEFDLKSTPLRLGMKFNDLVDNFLDGTIKGSVVEAVNDWFEKNQRRRNISADSYCKVILYTADEKDKLLTEVISELQRIGVQNIRGEFSPASKWSMGGIELGMKTIKLTAGTYKQFKEGGYSYTATGGVTSPSFTDCTWGNGYNEFSAADMNILRHKLYDCMTSTTCEVLETNGNRGLIKLPSYYIVLKAQYDKGKLKDLLNYLKNDNRLQNFAKRMDDMSRGIDTYYASKRPGDYVGD